jgi:hypothetical protein
MHEVGVVILALAGAAMAIGFLRPSSSNYLEVCGLSILLGLGLVPVGLLIVGLTPVTAVVTLTLFAGLLALAGYVIRPRPASHRFETNSSGRDLLLLPVVLASIALLAIFSGHATLGGDGLFVWEFKARAICLANGVVPAQLFRDSTVGWFQPQYPLLLPLAEAWNYVWAGSCDQSQSKLFGPIYFVAISCVLVGVARRWTGHVKTGLLAGLLLVSVPLMFVGAGSAASGYADIVLAAYYLCAVVYFIDGLKGDSTRAVALSGLLAGLCVWAKQEGLVYWVVMLCAVTVAVVRNRRKHWILLWMAPGLVVLASWRLFLTLDGTLESYDFLPFTFDTLSANASRLPDLAALAAQEMSDADQWGLFWGVVLVALLFRHASTQLGYRTSLAWFVICPILVWTGIYVFSAWNPYVEHVRNSQPRLILQTVPTAALFVSLWFDGPLNTLRLSSTVSTRFALPWVK